MYFAVTVLLVVRMIVHRNIVDIHCDAVLPKLLKHGLSVVVLHLYDIEMPSAVRLRQLIRRHNIRAVRKRLIVALCDLPSASKETVQLPHLAAAERTLDICHAVVIAKIELLIKPRSLISRHQIRISGNSVAAEQH